MADFLGDLRHAARRLCHRPLFTAVAVATMALAIGAVTAIFSVVHGVLLRPLPVAGEDALVRLWKYDPGRDFDQFPFTFDEFVRWREENESFVAIAAMVSEGSWPRPLAPSRPEGEPTLVAVAPVSAEFFDVAGVRPLLGRGFERGDEADAEVRATVVAHDAWRRRFGGDPDLVGRTITVGGRPHLVVGVMPPGFDYPAEAEMWECLAAGTRAELTGLGRLRAGIARGEARAEIETIAHRYAREKAPFLADKTVVATPLRESVVGEVRRPLLVLLAAVGFLLAIASVNVANLFLIETAARRRQFAIRRALGAPRGRLVRQLMTESALVAALGALAGIALGAGGLRLLVASRPGGLPRLDEVGLHPPVLAFTVLVTAASALVFGLVPGLRAARGAGWLALRGGPASDRRGSRLLRLLAVAETGLALVLLAGAGLLVRSFAEQLRLDRGIRTDHLLSVSLKVPAGRSFERDQVIATYAAVLPRLEALPGVEAVSPMLNRPFATTDGFDLVPKLEGRPPEETAGLPWVSFDAVTPGFVEALGLHLVAGRFFDRRDQEASLPVTVVNQALAEALWPDESAVGRRIMAFGDEGWRTVVGVISDARLRHATEVRLALLIPLAQSRWAPFNLAVRTARDPDAAVAPVRRELRQAFPGAVVEIAPFASLLGEELAAPRASALLVTFFAALALGLAAVGIYGVMGSLVGERRHEIGVRMALGASAGNVLRLMLGDGIRLALAGVAVGVAGAAALTRLIAGLLFRTRPLDPATFAVVTAVLLAVACLAALAPARRAARVDPLSVMRAE